SSEPQALFIGILSFIVAIAAGTASAAAKKGRAARFLRKHDSCVATALCRRARPASTPAERGDYTEAAGRMLAMRFEQLFELRNSSRPVGPYSLPPQRQEER